MKRLKSVCWGHFDLNLRLSLSFYHDTLKNKIVELLKGYWTVKNSWKSVHKFRRYLKVLSNTYTTW